MRRERKRLLAAMLAFVMVFMTFGGQISTLNVQAATTKTMAHLKAGSGNGNGHFNGTSEAFVLSDKADITNEALSFQFKFESTTAETRFRFVTKYVSNSDWAYIAYDGATNHWFAERPGGWPDITGLPALNQGDFVNVSTSYETDGLHVNVENVTAGTEGSAVITDATVVGMKDKAGKIGFGAATFGTEYTDVYFSDVTVGGEASNEWTLFDENAAGQVWEPAVEVTVPEEGGGEVDPPNPPAGEGRAWWTLTGGPSNGGGHSYGNPAVSAPVTLLDNTKRTEAAKTLSLAVKPSSNWGVFYSYVDDNNWLYVGHDSSSQWYYQYKVNGAENYPKISGLPAPVEGEEMQLSISMDRETLIITVNDTTVYVTNQALFNVGTAIAGGRFGVKTNGQTTIEFADVTYNGANCMEDEWVFAAERAGQVAEKTYEKLVPLTGTVTDADGAAIEGAKVRVGTKSATTDSNGQYQFAGLEIDTYNMSVTKPGYEPYSGEITLEDIENNVKDIQLSPKAALDLTQYDSIESDTMKVYVGKNFPVVARYEMKSDSTGATYFRGNEETLNTIVINGVSIEPEVTVGTTPTPESSKAYSLHAVKDDIDVWIDVVVSVEGNTLTWEVTKINKMSGCPKIATIDIPQLNLVSVDASETESVFAGAGKSTSTTDKKDTYITFDDGFVPSARDGYLYGFLSNGKLSAGLHSNSEAEGDQRVIRNNGAETMSLTSAPWYYESGDKNGQRYVANYEDYPLSELPYAKVAIAADANGDGDIDWNDGAIAYRDIMNVPYGSEKIKDMVNYRIVMNFASMAPNPYLATADNIKKVYLATDGLPQSVMLKGYGNEGHDSANSEYADIAEREGGVEDFQDLIKIAHDYNTEIGIHVNAQEVYPEAKSYNPEMAPNSAAFGWGWLDQSHTIDKLWDLSSQARWKRFVQLYDRINGTSHLNLDWEQGQYVKDSQGTVDISKKELQKEAESKPDNMDFIYLDVWYQNSWETRRIAEEINSLGWRFSTEFSDQGEYDSTWQHWATDAAYGGAGMKGFNSDIIRFIRNDQRDSQVLNYPKYGGTADNPLLGGYRLYGFEGWGGDRSYDNYIFETFNQNLPTKFLQHYQVIDWENYEAGQSPVGNTEKKITLENEDGDRVVVERKTEQRTDTNIERTITLNGKKVLDDVTYLLPWTDAQDGTEKLYHWNMEGGTTTWELPEGWTSAVMYELSDQGRINEQNVAVTGGSVTLEAKAATAYVLVKGAGTKTLKNDFGEADYVVDPGFNGYADGASLDAAEWSGDIADEAVVVEKAETGDQRLAFNSPAADVAVTTTISGLETGKKYVAEVYVENNSDAKASITVKSGETEVSNYAERSFLTNYVKCDPKNRTMMQRMQVSFEASGPVAIITLGREAGEGATYMDDIRIVEKTLDNFQADGSFKQDFETVVQGLYPFVLGSAQGVEDPVTHLSQLNAPYTQKGYGGKVTDDVITDGTFAGGEWSLKHHGINTGIIYQTIPQNFRFEPGKVYTVEFDYQTNLDKAYAIVVGNGTTFYNPAVDDRLPQATTTQHVTMTVTGEVNGQTWIGLYEDGSRGIRDSEGRAVNSRGENDFTLDNLVIREDETANVITIEKTELYKGDQAKIIVNGDADITWTSSNPEAAVVDEEAMVVKALADGTTTLTAEYKDGTTQTFEITVKSGDMIAVPSDGLSGEANTQETTNESAPAGSAVDGKSGTFWHTAWSYNIQNSGPAVLTVNLGETMNLAGFKFQQRPDASPTRNGTVKQYKYEYLDAEGNVISASEVLNIPEDKQSAGAWISNVEAVEGAQFIRISVTQGQGGFAAIAEVVPMVEKLVATTATLTDAAVEAGQSVTLKPNWPEDKIVPTGLTWSSSDTAIAMVDESGRVTGIKEGTVTITLSNALGELATCTVTVSGEVVIVDKSELQGKVDAYSELEEKNYTPDSWKVFEAAMEAAREVLADPNATDDDVQNAVEALTAAFNGLKEAEETKPVDKSQLQNKVTEVSKLDEKNYTKDSWKAFETALQAAKSVLADKNATEKEVAAALAELNAKTAALQKVSEPGSGSNNGSDDNNDSNGGSSSGSSSGSNTQNAQGAATGDSTNVWIWVVLLIAAGAVLGVLYYKKEKAVIKFSKTK